MQCHCHLRERREWCSLASGWITRVPSKLRITVRVSSGQKGRKRQAPDGYQQQQLVAATMSTALAHWHSFRCVPAGGMVLIKSCVLVVVCCISQPLPLSPSPLPSSLNLVLPQALPTLPIKT
jgi:hypothetical protein